MTRRLGVYLAVAASVPLLSLSAPASAAELPPIKTSDENRVAECATPGRLMSYLKSSNEKLDPKFEAVATEYMRQGEELGVRWDYAFFQMLLETAYLRYSGDVKPDQNNFAGLGATGGGVHGESFKDIASGARAHLQHLLMYAGDHIDNPVAERTKNVQEWGVLDSWLKKAPRPITFTAMTKEWAPGSRGYSRDIETIAGRFFNGACNQPDPHPELVAEARRGVTVAISAGTAKTETKGTELARRANDAARAEGDATRTGLGAVEISKPAATAAAVTTPPAKSADVAKPAATVAAAATTPPASPPVKILNSAPPDSSAAAAPPAASTKIETASVAGAAKTLGVPAARKDAGKCRVWTASYGGSKAIIIKAVADQTTNYTVLDVNDGTEKREADAYIDAYAKGGERMGEFPSQSQALDKAFELCPDG